LVWLQTHGDDVNLDSLFDVQIKRIHEYKRQHLNIFSIIHRYKELKAMTPEQRKQVCVGAWVCGSSENRQCSFYLFLPMVLCFTLPFYCQLVGNDAQHVSCETDM
jgi:hypothetical protein